MACANPLTQYNKYLGKSIEIPCNRCLNCRIDKRNMWSDRANYAFKEYSWIGAFVTFTYDDFHLFDSSLSGSVHVTDSKFSPDNKSYVTLQKSDVTHLINRIRSYLRYHDINNTLSRQDFKYIAVGEYGGEYGRPHYHVLFFGLDWATNKFLFNKCWKSGLVDVRPILDGGINYVLKYLDKQLFGDQLFDAYEKYYIQPPFKTQSPSLGSNLYLDAITSGFAFKNNNSYKSKKNILRPIPSYYKKKYINPFDQRSFLSDYSVNLFNSTLSSDKQVSIKHSYYGNFPKYKNNKSARFDFQVFNKLRSQLRERVLTEYCRNNGLPVNDPSSYSEKSFNGNFYILKSDVPRVPNSWQGVINEL